MKDQWEVATTHKTSKWISADEEDGAEGSSGFKDGLVDFSEVEKRWRMRACLRFESQKSGSYRN
jgi:hypothetical protein